jgi:TonB family protein
MKRPQVRSTWLVCAVGVLALGSTPAWAQADNPPKPVSLGAQAVAVVLKHYAINPSVHHSTTGLPLPADGSWSLSKTRPASCPQTDDKCVEVFYDVPSASVRCSWVVLLNADTTDGQFLDENKDAASYLARVLSRGDAAPLISSRSNPVYPPIAIASQVQGDVPVNVIVGKQGEVQNARMLSGPPMLAPASIDAAKKWTFKPFVVGSNPVPYQVKLVFRFQIVMPQFTRATGDLAP